MRQAAERAGDMASPVSRSAPDKTPVRLGVETEPVTIKHTGPSQSPPTTTRPSPTEDRDEVQDEDSSAKGL